ncbi:MAG: ABC transporter permease [Candidatus Saccharibacteria bacterium]
MNLIKILATAQRVLKQLRHDPRTLVLLFVVPSLLITLLKYVFQDASKIFDSLVPMLLGIFPMIMMFLITSIATLRERRSGTLNRLMTMPVSKLDFILGYALAFSLVAFLQASITCLITLNILGVSVLGGTLATLIGAVASALLGTALGLFLSAFATSEFQAVQFMPAIIFPQLLVCGLFVPRDQMADPLQWFANVLPLTYSVDAMRQVTLYSDWTDTYTWDLIVVLGVAALVLVLGAITIRRQENV